MARRWWRRQDCCGAPVAWWRPYAVAAAWPALAVAVVGICLVWRSGPSPEPARPPMGWAGAAAEAELAAELGPRRVFALDGPPVETRGKNVRLWEAVRLATGRDLPHLRQLLGDCVAASACNAIAYRQAVQMAILGEPGALKTLYPPYLYGAARVNLGRYKFGCAGLRSDKADGCLNGAIAAAAEKFGFLPADTPGLPAYSTAIGREWGCYGVPEQWRAIGGKMLVRATGRVPGEPQAAQSLCNGYPLTAASNWGGMDKPPVVEGRLLNRRVTEWGHQMAVIAYDDSDGDGRGHYYVLNQWGENYHGVDPAGGPLGGFWIAAADMAWICANGEVISWSSADGFPALDWELTLRRAATTQVYVGAQ